MVRPVHPDTPLAACSKCGAIFSALPNPLRADAKSPAHIHEESCFSMSSTMPVTQSVTTNITYITPARPAWDMTDFILTTG